MVLFGREGVLRGEKGSEISHREKAEYDCRLWVYDSVCVYRVV